MCFFKRHREKDALMLVHMPTSRTRPCPRTLLGPQVGRKVLPTGLSQHEQPAGCEGMGNAFEIVPSHLHSNWPLYERIAVSTGRVSNSRNICWSSTGCDCMSQSTSSYTSLASTWGELPCTTVQAVGRPSSCHPIRI